MSLGTLPVFMPALVAGIKPLQCLKLPYAGKTMYKKKQKNIEEVMQKKV